MKIVTLLLVGIGGYGENYIQELLISAPSHTKLVAIVDPFIDNSSWKDEIIRQDIPIFRTLEEFYALGGVVDLVVISSPIHTHYAYITSALEHQSNVLCEKPVTIDVQKMEELIKRERDSGHFVAVGYQLCFSSALLELKQDIREGIFGSPLRFKALRMMRRGDSYYTRNGWAGKLRCHGEFVLDSPLSNACAHQLQSMFYLLGETEESTCCVTSAEGYLLKGRPSIENYDAASLCFHTDKNVDVYYYTAHCVDQKKVGPLGLYEFEKASITNQDDVFLAVFKDGTTKEYGKDSQEPKLNKLYHAIDCVRSGKRPSCSLVSSLAHTQAVILAQSLPVYLSLGAERTIRGDDPYWSVPGLKDAFLKAYEAWKIPDTCL